MASVLARDFFDAEMKRCANCVCFDTGAADPAWASVSHGIYVSIDAAGVHRSLGVRVSRVQSLELDAWKPVQLRMMELGGNERFRAFLIQQRVPEEMPIREKYATRAADWYRRNLRAMAEGLPGLEPLVAGTGSLPLVEEMSEVQWMLDQAFTVETALPQGGMPVSRPHCQEVRSLCQRLNDRIKVVLGSTKTGSAGPGADKSAFMTSGLTMDSDPSGLDACGKHISKTFSSITSLFPEDVHS